jgi:SNF2 family DNA or RNA helicase
VLRALSRQSIIRRFNKLDSTIKVFLISTKAGGLGT